MPTRSWLPSARAGGGATVRRLQGRVDKRKRIGPARGASRFLLAAVAAAACSSSSTQPPPKDIPFPPLGSLATPSGKGSFRFGVATAATQIEDQNKSTDWYLWTLPTAQGGLGKGADF